MYEAD